MVALWHTYALHVFEVRAADRVPVPAQRRAPEPAVPGPDDLRTRLPDQARDRLAHLPASTAFVAWTMARDGHSPGWLTRHLDISPGDAVAVCELAAAEPH
ncbi:MAG: hypothetical protein HOV71_15695 [Hamadaea sp.]|nr:hypothetical protein [Hamadaea sp.]NUR49573.1 hypothetical protein [Hamadaea sp.]NUT06201.1 hypothetical protein [Hamadaea sp.]